MASQDLNGSRKGTVAIETFKERLRLRWTHANKRYCLSLGFPNTAINIKAAKQLAARIELDMLVENFDASLKKYQTAINGKTDDRRVTVAELFDQFIAYKSKSLYHRSLEKYHTCTKQVQTFFGDNKLVDKLSVNDAELFVKHSQKKLAEFTLKERLTLIRACWAWGITQGLAKVNPWQELPERIKVPPKRKPQPFTKDELEKIFKAFAENRYYKHYLPFVQFRAWTGTRISEAIGLRWSDITDDDCSEIWIGSSLSRGDRKTTKNNKSRIIPCNPRIKSLLQTVKPKVFSPNQLVFRSPKGSAIRDVEFCKRAWRTCLKDAGVEYRSFYHLRHTFISHCLAQGLSPAAIAEITGHSVEILYKHYAGSISKILIPDF
jgi:integrase